MKIKTWTDGVVFDDNARQQVENIAQMPFIHKHVAVMPDVHMGMGATVGSVIPTKGAIIPAAVGVDIGCGMAAIRLNMTASDLPDSLAPIRSSIEQFVPVGFSDHEKHRPENLALAYETMARVSVPNFEHQFGFSETDYTRMFNKTIAQCGTLGGGNHFIELCLDEDQNVWVMLHSGSRGVGNILGSKFIERAKKEMERWMIQLPDTNLAYFPEGTEYFDQYVYAVNWAQRYARANRDVMLELVIQALSEHFTEEQLQETRQAINCHHNYVEKENHFGANVYVTRKGAVRARKGDLGIIPGSMGARSYIVEGLGNRDSFHSCSHGAGRVMSRTQAKKNITMDEHNLATEGVESRRDKSILDESPSAYKDIDAVMEAQKDLVSIKHTLKQVICVKG